MSPAVGRRAGLKPRLSVIITWCNRDILATTLERNAPALAEARAEVVVVNCGGEREAWKRLRQTPPGGVPVRWIDLRRQGFNKSLAINAGAFHAASPHLFLLDADVLLEPGVLTQGLSALTPGTFLTVARCFETTPPPLASAEDLREVAFLIEMTGTSGTLRIETSRIHLADGSRSAPGLVLVRRRDFLRVGGMNSGLRGWGWEDLDLITRLRTKAGLRHRTFGSVLHISHGDDVRDFAGTTRLESERRNRRACLENYSAGRLTGTFKQDVRRLRPPSRGSPQSSAPRKPLST